VAEADIDRVAEEIDSMGRTEKLELMSRLAILPTRLLKWRYQPDRRGASWRATIRAQRRSLARQMGDNPRLKAVLPDAIAEG
jgi:hypothetical protein